MTFHFDQDFVDFYADLMVETNIDDFLDFGGEFLGKIENEIDSIGTKPCARAIGGRGNSKINGSYSSLFLKNWKEYKITLPT